MNFERGFRRLAWLAIALALPFVGYLLYDSSSHMVGYEPWKINSDLPESVNRTSVQLGDIGFVYVPDYLSEPEISAFMSRYFDKRAALWSEGRNLLSVKDFAAAVRKKLPEFAAEKDDLILTKRVMTKYPVYRSQVFFREYEAVPRYEKRPWVAVGQTAGVMVALILVIHGSISLVAWAVRGFKTT